MGQGEAHSPYRTIAAILVAAIAAFAIVLGAPQAIQRKFVDEGQKADTTPGVEIDRPLQRALNTRP